MRCLAFSRHSDTLCEPIILVLPRLRRASLYYRRQKALPKFVVCGLRNSKKKAAKDNKEAVGAGGSTVVEHHGRN